MFRTNMLGGSFRFFSFFVLSLQFLGDYVSASNEVDAESQSEMENEGMMGFDQPSCYENDKAYIGYPMNNPESKGRFLENCPNPEHCQMMCQEDEKCEWFNWSNLTDTATGEYVSKCWMKTGKGNMKEMPGVITGPKYCKPMRSCIERGRMYIGDPLNMWVLRKNNFGRQKSETACQDLCQRTAGCEWFNWNKNSKCWLKKSHGQQIKTNVREEPGVSTGPRECPEIPANENCEEGWRYFEGRCYLVHLKTQNSTYTYSDASNECIDRNASLASLQSRDEYNFIIDVLDRNYFQLQGVDFWIGAQRTSDDDSTYTWEEDGEVVEILKWAGGQPISGNTCLQLVRDNFTTYMYESEHCEDEDDDGSFICEKPATILEIISIAEEGNEVSEETTTEATEVTTEETTEETEVTTQEATEETEETIEEANEEGSVYQNDLDLTEQVALPNIDEATQETEVTIEEASEETEITTKEATEETEITTEESTEETEVTTEEATEETEESSEEANKEGSGYENDLDLTEQVALPNIVCALPAITNGEMDCAGSDEWDCIVTCADGYSPYPHTRYFCKEGAWTKSSHREPIEVEKIICSPSKLIMGGCSVLENKTMIQLSDSHETCQLPALSASDQCFYGYTLDFVDGELMACGGFPDTKRCLKFDYQTKTWSSVTELQYKRMDSVSVVVGPTLHLIGGSEHMRKEEAITPSENLKSVTNHENFSSPAIGDCSVAISSDTILTLTQHRFFSYNLTSRSSDIVSLPMDIKEGKVPCTTFTEEGKRKLFVANTLANGTLEGHEEYKQGRSFIYDIESKTWTQYTTTLNAYKQGELVTMEGGNVILINPTAADSEGRVFQAMATSSWEKFDNMTLEQSTVDGPATTVPGHLFTCARFGI